MYAQLHDRLEELAAESILSAMGPDVDAAQAHAAQGCSRCARVLVNARELAVDLSLSAPPVVPNSNLRTRVLGRGARLLAERAARPSRDVSAEVARGERVRDPSATVGAMHASGSAETVRSVEAARVSAMTPRPDEGTERLLAQLERITGFPVVMVSVVDGDRAAYRVARGLPPKLAASRETRRELSFCTHGVTSDFPLIVEDATNEPFFRGSSMVRRHGIGAYFGVPLRTSRRVAIGMLCAMDFRPRRVTADMVRVLELFAARVAAEIELIEQPAGLCGILEGAPGPGELYTQPWFFDLLSVELKRAQRARSAALVVASAIGSAALASVALPDEVAGRAGPDAVGLLLSGADATTATLRCEQLRRSLPRVPLGVAMADVQLGGPAAWRLRALAGV
jgi:hypothetical protein